MRSVMSAWAPRSREAFLKGSRGVPRQAPAAAGERLRLPRKSQPLGEGSRRLTSSVSASREDGWRQARRRAEPSVDYEQFVAK